MDLEQSPPASTSLVECCQCGCSCSNSGAWFRSVKRKHDELDEQTKNSSIFTIPGFDHTNVVRVEIENECMALREMVTTQQQTIHELSIELDEERNASSSAANEAMSMILRLQREKAEIQMEARQFKRFAEEKIEHDQQELYELDDLLYKREQDIQALTCEVQAYKHRMMSYGLKEDELEGGNPNNIILDNLDGQIYSPNYDYPPIKCNLNETHHREVENEAVDVDKYAFGETPQSMDHLKDLEYRINQLEKSPSNDQLDGEFTGTKDVLEKVVVGHSPRRTRHSRRFSSDSKNGNSDFFTDSPRKKMMELQETSVLEKVADDSSEIEDKMSDRVYSLDTVQNGEEKEIGEMGHDFMNADGGEPEIKELYTRLQALEADRESMRQAIISMRTDKAQLVLLKEIAQHLCKDMSPQRRVPVKKPSVVSSFSFMSIFKWVASFVFWRKKARRSKYVFGMSGNNAGLLMLLDKTPPRPIHWRNLSTTQI